jgi:DNA-binding GntR family transcriptional regulator
VRSELPLIVYMYTIRAMGSRTLAHEIADDVRRLIEHGDYEPGAPLRQEEIALRLGVSRIPVREALRLLERDGLVAVQANRGAYVLQHDEDAVAELFDVRLMLESDLLKRASSNLSYDAIAGIAMINSRLSTTRVKSEWIALDEEFHFTIYAAAGRPQTLELARTLRRSLNAYYLRYLGPQSRASDWNDEHQNLLRHLERRDADKAIAVLEQHLRGTQALLLSAMGGGRHV